MIKTVLVHLTGSETDKVALQTALQIVCPFGGHLDCLRTRLDPDGRVEVASNVAMASAIAVSETVSALRRQDVLLTERAQRNFNKFCESEILLPSEKPKPGPKIRVLYWIDSYGAW